MVPDGEDGFPAGDGIGADDRVGGAEVLADVFGGTTWVGVEFEGAFGGCLVEVWLSVGGCKGFEESLVGSGDTVIELVAGGPESVYK